jgi:hypothetical protein
VSELATAETYLQDNPAIPPTEERDQLDGQAPVLGRKALLGLFTASMTAVTLAMSGGEPATAEASEPPVSRSELVQAAKSNSHRACEKRTKGPETCSPISVSKDSCTFGPKVFKSLSEDEGSCRSKFYILGGSYTRLCTNQRLIFRFEEHRTETDGGVSISYEPVFSKKSARWKCS